MKESTAILFFKHTVLVLILLVKRRPENVHAYFFTCPCPYACSAVCEFVCDLIYNVTMSRIHTFIQGLVFQSVLKQEIAFFDKSTTGWFS